MASRAEQIRNINRRVKQTKALKPRLSRGCRFQPNCSSFDQKYEITRTLNRNGRYGQTAVCVEKHNRSRQYITKTIHHQNFYPIDRSVRSRYVRAVLDEMYITQTVHHPQITRVHRIFEEGDSIYAVTEKLRGGSLFDRLSSQTLWTEQYIAGIIKQVLSGLDYMHRDNRMEHRHLSPKKILFVSPESQSKEPLIKITGFGVSKALPIMLQNNGFNQLQDAPYWTAPELLPGAKCNGLKVHGAADIWSVGVILFFMIYGFYPFSADRSKYGVDERDEIFRQIRSFKGFTFNDFPNDIVISKKLKLLIARMMHPNAKKRPNARQVLRHPWIVNLGNLDENAKVANHTITRSDNISDFHVLSQYKSTVSNMFQSQYRRLRTHHLRDLYRFCGEYDHSQSGVLTSYQFELILNKMCTVGLSVDTNELKKANQHYLALFAGHFMSFWMRRMTTHLPQSANDVTSIIQMYLSPPQKSIPSIGGGSFTLPRPIGIQYKGFLNSLVHDFMMYNDRKLYKAMSKVDQWKDGQIQTTRALEVFKQIDPPYEREVALEVADKLERNGEINYEEFLRESRSHFSVESLWDEDNTNLMGIISGIPSPESIKFEKS